MKIYNRNNEIIYDGLVEDNSFLAKSIKGDNNLTIYLKSATHIEFPLGAYCDFQGERYTIMRPENIKMTHSRAFTYVILFESNQAKAKRWKFRNPVDGRLRFSLTAKPIEHLRMVVDNLNKREGGWTIGECIDDTEHTINYDHHFILRALSAIAEEFKTEYEIKDKKISLKKVEYNKQNPLPLSYGFGNGFKQGIGRSNESDNPPVEILFVQGGTENIDPSKYGNKELLLPEGGRISYDGDKFENEKGFNAKSARLYIVSSDRLSIQRANVPSVTLAEDSLNCSEIYPKREGIINEVVVASEEKHFYDIIDNSIPESLNFCDNIIKGEHMSIIFQSGMLSGREFEVKYVHKPSFDKKGRRFEIIPQEIDGEVMPNSVFKPSEGDKYAVFKCTLPKAYICDNKTKTGAEWDMFKTAVKYKYEHEEEKFTFTGTLDGIWAKKDWENIGGRLILGGYILFSDERFQKEGVKVRITAIRQEINNPHSPKITLSNTTVQGGLSGTIKELQAQEVEIEESRKEVINFTKRRFRDAQETSEMLQDLIEKDLEALEHKFSEGVSPISVQTMQMIAGDESLQFRYIDNPTSLQPVEDGIYYDVKGKKLVAPTKYIQHLTLGINSISSNHKNDDYYCWKIDAFKSGSLDDENKRYYLYIQATEQSDKAKYYLSEKALPFKSNEGYNFLVGFLNSEYEGSRSFVSLYGFSEILPGRITTDKIISNDGLSYFDLAKASMKLGDSLSYNTQGDGKLELRGTFVVSPSGDSSPLGCYRGNYADSTTYYSGDEVTFELGGVKSTYRRYKDKETTGISPTNSNYWRVVAEGVKGQPGEKGKDGKDGLPGIDGKDGAKGSPGRDGKDGAKGDKGDTGAKGDKGDTGAKGDKGNPGKDGKNAYPPIIKNGHWWFADEHKNYTDSGFSAIGKDGRDGDDGNSPYVGSNGNWFEWKDGSYHDTKIKAHGDKGDKGADGKDGKDGAKGDKGEKGEKGEDAFLIIAYANDEYGNGFSYAPQGKRYIGVCNTYDESNWEAFIPKPSAFQWSLIQGEKGEDGLPGAKGKDGKTPYLHIAYADTSTGGGFIQNPSGKAYIGTYSDFTQKDSNSPSKYKWAKVKGEPGQDGVDGKNGRDGKNGAKGDKGDKGSPGKDGKNAYPPIIKNGHWWFADEHKNYTDSGFSAIGKDGRDGDDGNSPYVGSNGNWFEWKDGSYHDTKIKAHGDKGDKGADGKDGKDGAKGDKGEKGEKGDKGEDGKDIDESKFDYLRKALLNTTEINGGVILSSVIGVRGSKVEKDGEEPKVTAYMSGMGNHALATGVKNFGEPNETQSVYIDDDGRSKIGRMYFEKEGDREVETIWIKDDDNKSRVGLSIKDVDSISDLIDGNTNERIGRLKINTRVKNRIFYEHNSPLLSNVYAGSAIKGAITGSLDFNLSSKELSAPTDALLAKRVVKGSFNIYIENSNNHTISHKEILVDETEKAEWGMFFPSSKFRINLNRSFHVEGVKEGNYRVSIVPRLYTTYYYSLNGNYHMAEINNDFIEVETDYEDISIDTNILLTANSKFIINNRATFIGANGVSVFKDKTRYAHIDTSDSHAILSVKGGANIDLINGATPAGILWQGYYDDENRRLYSNGWYKDPRKKGRCTRIGQGHYRVYFPSNLYKSYTIMATADSQEHWNKYACLYKKSSTYFEIKTADDDSPNDSGFSFQVISTQGWLIS